jgi:hypothetical protein|tara:strand:+ start:1209 stop:1409 length:201 start_codon:yes stop_codon:yes gene_type:complete
MKVGDLVEFSYGRVGGQIDGIGIFAERGYYGLHKVLFMGKAYWVPDASIKVISMQRSCDLTAPLDN